MALPMVERFLGDEAATMRLGEDLAMALRPGDVLALHGDLGAGKSTLARALIRALADDGALDVPSPTFTLVQSYDTRVPVHHFDLYRLSSADELEELGFPDVLKDGAALIEWPERADRLPDTTITVELVHQDEGRSVRVLGEGAGYERVVRSLAMRDFLDNSGWGAARRRHFVGDASARSYEIVSLADQAPRVLMNSPRLVLGPPVRDGRPYAEIAHTAQTVAAFVGIDRLLREADIAAPEIHAQDLDKGFLLIEHLGTEGLLASDGTPIVERYALVSELLAFMHGKRWSDRVAVAQDIFHVVPPFDRDAMLIEAELLIDWYLPAIRGHAASDEERNAFRAAWNAVLDRISGAEPTLMLRDVQSPNFIWRGDRAGFDRLGIVDFQDALIGPSAYDVASLALDPRVTIEPAFERAVVDAYVAARSSAGRFDRSDFEEAYAIMGAQRHSKILGIFVRLDRRDGKPHYLKHLPRIRDYLRRLLIHPALAEVRVLYDRLGVLEEPA
ncbi:tRNA (adenosine(37)-N6)-threonylcarbamoyltransferase complex ATPase subunit type 1 TsaE [Mesorhizobium sp. NPDC059054]|uniref:tRNA (adenosine(37)-N6)-threonylcarbamoyltransferase complex ATPase subunit type 1 TsaE n=1 Tax=Mesorhizobium sp. NPDC059054 TaxID=3346711 RepID=UPI0036ABF2C0